MNRIEQVQSFIEHDLKNNYLIEPKNKYNAVKERLFDVIKSYNPGVIIKAGIGHGDLLLDINKNFNIYTVVIDPSFSSINDFLKRNKNNINTQKLTFINGDFNDLPVDYYSANLLVCVDYLDFFDSGKSINEFRRALQFDGILFLATVTLHNEDIDGIYDDFIKMIFPLHNDYYIPEDITTLLELKEFKMIKNMQLSFKNNLQSMTDYFQNIFNSVSKENAAEFINSHKKEFIQYMRMEDNYDISEPYYIGVFMREKPEKV